MTEKDIQALSESLRKTMAAASEWEQKKTSIPGIYLVRLPGHELRVMLEFNPPDESGNPSKRKGLYFADRTTLDAARKVFPDPRMDDLVAAVEALRGKAGPPSTVADEVFQI